MYIWKREDSRIVFGVSAEGGKGLGMWFQRQGRTNGYPEAMDLWN